MSKDRGQWVPRALVVAGLAFAQGSARPVEKVHASDLPLNPENVEWDAEMELVERCADYEVKVKPHPLEGATGHITGGGETVPGFNATFLWDAASEAVHANVQWQGSGEPPVDLYDTADRPLNCETTVTATNTAVISTETQATVTPSATGTAEPTVSSTATASNTVQPTATETGTAPFTATPTPTDTDRPTASSTASKTATATAPGVTETVTDTTTSTATSTLTATRIVTGTASATSTPSATALGTATETQVQKSPTTPPENTATVPPAPSKTPTPRLANTPVSTPKPGGEAKPQDPEPLLNLSLLPDVVATGGPIAFIVFGMGVTAYALTRIKKPVN